MSLRQQQQLREEARKAALLKVGDFTQGRPEGAGGDRGAGGTIGGIVNTELCAGAGRGAAWVVGWDAAGAWCSRTTAAQGQQRQKAGASLQEHGESFGLCHVAKAAAVALQQAA